MILLKFYCKWSKHVLNYHQFSSGMPSGHKQKTLAIRMSSVLFLCLDFYWGRRWNEPQASCTACLQWGWEEQNQFIRVCQNYLRAVFKNLLFENFSWCQSYVSCPHFFCPDFHRCTMVDKGFWSKMVERKQNCCVSFFFQVGQKTRIRGLDGYC